jgi:hypothetical protein
LVKGEPVVKLEPFTIHHPSMEELAKRLGTLYQPVSLSRDPMFSWVQMTNDVTILGEELRRDRDQEAIDRAGKVLIRLLEFIGYYLYVYDGDSSTFAGLVAQILRRKSYVNYLPSSPKEGPTRWILVKYPFACSKCGRSPCHCLLEPWVLEDRREDPESYLKRFKAKADKARTKLKSLELTPFSLFELIEHFRKIYRNTHHHQEPWKIGMHLSEEIGEATAELSRIELRWRAERAEFDIGNKVDKIFEIAKDKLENQSLLITDDDVRDRRLSDVRRDLAYWKRRLSKDPWGVYGTLVGEKFKEEIADVFSWLAALIIKLDPALGRFEEFPNRFTKQGEGGVPFLGCPWCRKDRCSDACLLTHGVSSEIVEKISKF